MQLNPNMKKCLWPWSLFSEADRNRVRSVYTASENRFQTRGGQVLHNKLWSRWNIMQMTLNMKNTFDPDLFFKSWIGIEYVQYIQWLKKSFRDRRQAGPTWQVLIQLRYYTGDPEHEKYLFFQRRIGIEYVQYIQLLKIVSRQEAGRFHITSSDPDEIICGWPGTWKIPLTQISFFRGRLKSSMFSIPRN